MDIKEQKRIAKSVLDILNLVDYRAIIAGGAARDWYNETLASDIDIFICIEWKCGESKKRFVERVSSLLELLLNVDEINVVGNIDEDDGLNYIKNPDIISVLEFIKDNVKFQIILMNNQNVDVTKFAFNICQAWSNGERIATTEAFKIGFKKKIIIETGTLYANGKKYRQKIKSKFPDFDFVDIKNLC